jgi:signal transduction histidine kinase
MNDFSLDYLSAKGIHFHYAVSPGIMDIPLSMEQRKNMFLILKEAINNAVKYAQCSEVKLNVEPQEGEIVMSICDDGAGFNPSNPTTYNGNGLKNMRARANAIGGELQIISVQGKGTEIVLRYKLNHRFR